ncbi:hypothetical protein EDC01DRAFT_653059 [Geopyxis carbonaria]|nr:hypothetical protein EDC01DRAFT_653059 [Geopyxis carbonaria]
MAVESTPKQWADGPFELLTTPLVSTPVEEHDDFTIAASEMCLVHNSIIRALNSIYLQAPHISPADVPDFVTYCKAWCGFIHVHHDGEEAHFFPQIAAATGVPNIMEINVNQHQSFGAGLRELEAYIKTCTEDNSQYNGAQICSLIDSFAPDLTTHLHGEIPTLLALREYKDKVDIVKFSHDEGKLAMGGAPKTDVLAIFFTNLDMTFEDSRHGSFPPAPPPVKFFLRYIATLPKRKLWRFSSCTRSGKPKDLWALGNGRKPEEAPETKGTGETAT